MILFSFFTGLIYRNKILVLNGCGWVDFFGPVFYAAVCFCCASHLSLNSNGESMFKDGSAAGLGDSLLRRFDVLVMFSFVFDGCQFSVPFLSSSPMVCSFYPNHNR